MLCGTEEPVGLALNDFDGYVRVPLSQVYAAGQKDESLRVVRVVRTGDTVRHVVSIPVLMEIIQRRCRNGER